MIDFMATYWYGFLIFGAIAYCIVIQYDKRTRHKPYAAKRQTTKFWIFTILGGFGTLSWLFGVICGIFAIIKLFSS